VLRNNQTQEITYLPVGGLFFAIGELAHSPPSACFCAPFVAMAQSSPGRRSRCFGPGHRKLVNLAHSTQPAGRCLRLL